MSCAKNGVKICSRCKKELLLKFFSKDKNNKDGLNYWCRECINKYYQDNIEKKVKYYQNHKEKIAKKHKEYRQNHKEEQAEYNKKYNQTPIGIYSIIKQTAKNKNLSICSREEFVEWYDKQKQECVYCDIPKDLLKPLEWGRKKFRNRLTVDRIDNNKGYLINNICLACYKCNRIKNNLWTFNETCIMAQREMKPKWQKLYKILK